jgi:hypothetical protein
VISTFRAAPILAYELDRPVTALHVHRIRPGRPQVVIARAGGRPYELDPHRDPPVRMAVPPSFRRIAGNASWIAYSGCPPGPREAASPRL